MMSPSRLASWVKRVPKSTVLFELHFISGDDTSELLQSWNVSEVRADTDSWCEGVLGICQDDCNEQRELESRYKLIAHSKEKAVASQAIRVKPSEDSSLDDPLGVGSTAGHSTNAQLVRMNEVMLRMQVGSLKRIFDGYNNLIDVQAKEIASLRRRETEMVEAVQLAAIKQLGLEEDEQRSSVALAKLGTLLEKHAPDFFSKFAQTVTQNGIPEV
jgi:hypothetical protein